MKAATTEELRAELARALKLTADHLVRLALVWAELERRGEDLSELKRGIGRYLPKIAAGVVLADTVVAFAGEPMLLQRVAALPVAEQKRVVETGQLPLPAARQRTVTDGPMTSRQTRVRTIAAETSAATQRPATRVEDMAKAATARDTAEMILRMIEANGDPKDVARRLLPELERIIKAKPKPAW